MAEKLKILFMAESITLSHVVRPAQLALSLPESLYEVHFATSEDYKELHSPKNAQFHKIHCMNSKEFQKRLDRGSSVFDFNLLEKQMQEDLELLSQIRPDIVVGDFRPSLSVSARLHGVPYMGIVNAYWSQLNQKNMPLPDILPFRLMGKSLATNFFEINRSFLLPSILKQHAKPLNKLRTKYGLTPLQKINECYLDADFVLFADALEVVSPDETFKSPFACLGPLVGTFDFPLPSWWNQIQLDHPLVYLNLGSSGNQKLIPQLIEELTKDPIQLIVGYTGDGSQTVKTLPNGAKIFFAGILPGNLVCERADVIINNGGSGGGYQALMAGKPFIGITKNLDQMLNMYFMKRHSFVREFMNWGCSPKEIRSAVNYFLTNDLEKKKALELKNLINRYDYKKSFQLACEQILSQRQSPTKVSVSNSL